jgi:hypothetical protein
MRTVKTASGARAVQIVHSSRRGSRDIEHIGSAHDDAELEVLKAVARQRLAAGQGELDLGLEPGGEPGRGGGGPLRHRHPSPPFEAGTPAEPERPAGRPDCGWLVPGEGGQHAPGDDCVHYQYFQRFGNFFGPAQLCDGKIKIGVWIRFVFQCVMPPLAIV